MRGSIKVNVIKHVTGSIPEQIEAKMLIVLEGRVAEFNVNIKKYELLRGYHFGFETSTSSQNSFRPELEAIFAEKYYLQEIRKLEFTIGILLDGHFVKTLELRKSKLISSY